ncbi:hypothetical protein DFS34DRAFT_498204 [Phlyctochytrium arcticum]|nr:hypothetical protein DFS34DRAFT_498204 [Phlyctochytrium arcticum]
MEYVQKNASNVLPPVLYSILQEQNRTPLPNKTSSTQIPVPCMSKTLIASHTPDTTCEPPFIESKSLLPDLPAYPPTAYIYTEQPKAICIPSLDKILAFAKKSQEKSSSSPAADSPTYPPPAFLETEDQPTGAALPSYEPFGDLSDFHDHSDEALLVGAEPAPPYTRTINDCPKGFDFWLSESTFEHWAFLVCCVYGPKGGSRSRDLAMAF